MPSPPISAIAVALLAAVVSGCAARGAPERESNLSGYSVAFRQGYADGCESARGFRVRKDQARYRDDADYMMGWNDGNSICGRRK